MDNAMYNKTVLDNGVRVISERSGPLRSVSLGIWVNAGSRDEVEGENGIFHFIEHMSFKGTRNRTSLQIAKELDALGGFSNAFTSKESTCFHAKVLDKHFIDSAGILSDVFLNSTFDPEDVERERQVIFQEISMVEDTPDDNIHVLFNRLFWIDHPIGMSTLGTDDTVSGIGRETILNYLNRFYVPERVLIAASGNVDHQSMVSYFKPLFEAIEASNSNPERSAPYPNSGLSIHYKELEQIHICLGGEAPSLSNDKRFACAIFNTILGGNMSSRLFQEIREKQGLAYSVYSFLSAYMDTGLLGVYVATDAGSVNPVLETVRREIQKIKKGELSESELSAAKDHLIGGMYLAAESSDNRMMRIAKNEFNFQRYVSYEEVASNLERVTCDEVVEVVSEIFSGNKIALATLGPLKEEDLDKNNLFFD
ncbi:MAG: insulinase family protein [Desulfobacteraceae bacterium]|nr:insulinase family protein [Desulfobacteraceae bacterium]